MSVRKIAAMAGALLAGLLLAPGAWAQELPKRALPKPWGLDLLPAFSPAKEQIHDFHDMMLVIITVIAVFVLGLILVALELFVFPGTILLGLMGAGIMLAALVMAMVDIYPGGPVLPSLPQVQVPLTRMTFSFAAAGVLCWLLSLWLPKSSIYARLVTKSASGEQSVARAAQVQTSRVGQVGVALSALRPGGKAQFGDDIIDVIAQGEMIAKGKQVRVIGHSSNDAIVEAA